MKYASITAWSINLVGDKKKEDFIAQVTKWLGDKASALNTFEVRFDTASSTATIFWYRVGPDGEKVVRPDGLGLEYHHRTVNVGDFDHSYYDGAYVNAEMWQEDE